MKVLVTGGGGFLGRFICRDLIHRSYEVVSYSRSHHSILEELGVQQIQGSLTDLDALRKAFAGIEAVFHVAAKAGVWGDYEDYYQTNVVGSENIIKLCHEFQVKYCVYTSTPSVVHKDGGIEGEDESLEYPKEFKAPYPKTKAIAEKMFLDANSDSFQCLCLRPHLIWGPQDHHFLPRLEERSKSGKLMLLGSGDYKVDHIYVENASLAHIQALEALMDSSRKADGRAYFISQNEPLAIKDLINSLLNSINQPQVKKFLPVSVGKLLGKVFEVFFKVFAPHKEPPLTHFVASQLSTPHWFNCKASKEKLGYKPLVSTKEGLKRLQDWYVGGPSGTVG